MGREVIERIVARGQAEVVVLTTKSATDLGLPEAVKAFTVDYNDPASLGSALKGVHTVISFIASPDTQLFASVQINLVDACIAQGVKRFAPSEWATCAKGEPAHYEAKGILREYLKRINTPVKKIEYSLFQPGFFTDYLAVTRPTAKYFHVQEMFIEFASRRALVPEHVDPEFVLTTVEDTAEVVARAVEYDGEWPEIGGICGQKIKVSELIKIGEELRGPFTVSKLRYDECKEGKASLPWCPLLTHPGIPVDMRLQFSEIVIQRYIVSLADGGWCVSDEWNRVFPDFKFTSAEEYVRKVWGN